MGEEEVGLLKGLMIGVKEKIDLLIESNTSQHKTLFDNIDSIKQRLSAVEFRVNGVITKSKSTFFDELSSIVQNRIMIVMFSMLGMGILLMISSSILGNEKTFAILSTLLK